MRFHQMYTWQYAPVRDNALRRHPLLLPYEQALTCFKHESSRRILSAAYAFLTA